MPRQQLHEYEGDRDYESYEIKALNGFVKKPWYIVRVFYFIPTETFEKEIVSPYFANKGSARRYAELHNIPLNRGISVYENKINKINNNMKKKKITETYLRNLIRESIRKNLQETIEENRKPWRGCTNVYMIYHGNWSDPELAADGYVANYWDIEDTMWQNFLEQTGYKDSDSNNPKVETEFNLYVRDMEDDVIDLIRQCGTPEEEGEFETINEDWKRGYKAAEMSEDFFEYNSALEHAEDLLHDLEDIYRDSDFSRYSSEIPNYNPDNNMRKTIKKFGEQVLQIYKYFKRKRAQKYNLDDLWQNQFEKETGTKVKDAEINRNAETSFSGGKYKIDNINAQRYNPDTDDYEDIG